MGEYKDYKDFTTLNAWIECQEVKLFFYKKILSKLPKKEQFNLGSQIRRAAISTTANIAEGYGRFHYQEGIQFFRIARGSLYELKDHLISCFELSLIDEALKNEGLNLIETAKKQLNGYINYTKSKINNKT